MKNILIARMLFFMAPSQALEISNVVLDETVQLDKHRLVLNGAGIRKKLFVQGYIGALYLGEKMHTAEAVLANVGAKRMSYYLLRDVSGRQMLDRINEAIVANNTVEEMKVLEQRFFQFEKIFAAIKELKKGDVINLDFIPGTGTQVLLNGTVKGRIEGADFYQSFLKTWVGSKPIQASLKKAVLGLEMENKK